MIAIEAGVNIAGFSLSGEVQTRKRPLSAALVLMLIRVSSVAILAICLCGFKIAEEFCKFSFGRWHRGAKVKVSQGAADMQVLVPLC